MTSNRDGVSVLLLKEICELALSLLIDFLLSSHIFLKVELDSMFSKRSLLSTRDPPRESLRDGFKSVSLTEVVPLSPLLRL